MKAGMKKTLYQVLGVQPDATVDEVSRAYDRLASEFSSAARHDPNDRVIAREAFHILSHPQRRAAYDASLVPPVPVIEMAEPLAFERGFNLPPSRRGTARPWARWMLAALILMAILGWWQLKKVARVQAARQSEAKAIAAQAQAARQAGAEAPAPAPAATVRSAEELFAQLSPSVALINVLDARGVQVASGSGVVIGNGVVITNCHVTKSGSQYQVRLGRDSLPASVAVADEEYDLCRLNVQGLTAPAVTIGSTATLRTGQKVYAIGAPQGLDLTISDGIVSSLRAVSGGTVIQTTAPISPGSSGGGLFDTAGTLVGIMTFQHRYGQNLNFAVPADWIRDMRTRSVGGVVGNLTMGEPERTASEQNAQPNNRILGSWLCFSTVGGRSIEITFQKNGTIIWGKNGKTYGGNYHFSGKTLSLHSKDDLNGSIDDITDNKMIINAGGGYRLVCNRT